MFTYFDDQAFAVRDKKTFEFFISILTKLKITDYQQQIINLIFKKWNNQFNQIEFLNFLINNPQTELFSFKSCTRKVKRNFELALTVIFLF